LIEHLGLLGDPVVVEEARKRFGMYLADPQSLPADLRRSVFLIVARHADPKVYQQIVDSWRANTSPEERNILLNALMSVNDSELFQKSLNLLLEPDLPGSSAQLALIVAANSPSGLKPVVEFYLQNNAVFSKKLSSFSRSSLWTQAARSSSNIEDLKLIDQIRNIGDKAFPDASLAKAASRITVGAHLKEVVLPVAMEWAKTSSERR
jgi:aminopeptidase N